VKRLESDIFSGQVQPNYSQGTSEKSHFVLS